MRGRDQEGQEDESADLHALKFFQRRAESFLNLSPLSFF